MEHNSHYWYFDSVQHKLITRFIPGKYHQYSHAWMPDWTERNSSSALCVSSVPCLWKSHSLSAAVFKTALKTCLRLTTASKLSVPSTFSCKYTTVGHCGGRNEDSLCLEQSWQVNGLALVPGLRLDCSCFTCCQEFLPCPNFYLPGPFTCISSNPLAALALAWLMQVPVLSVYGIQVGTKTCIILRHNSEFDIQICDLIR